MVGIAFGSFVTGALNGASSIISERAKHQDELDKMYQERLTAYDYAKQLQDARLAEQRAKDEADNKRALDVANLKKKSSNNPFVNGSITSAGQQAQALGYTPPDQTTDEIVPTTPPLPVQQPTPQGTIPQDQGQIQSTDLPPIAANNPAPQGSSPQTPLQPQVTTPAIHPVTVKNNTPLAPPSVPSINGFTPEAWKQVDPSGFNMASVLKEPTSISAAMAARMDGMEGEQYGNYISKLRESELKDSKTANIDPSTFSNDDMDYANTAIKLGVLKDINSLKPLSDKQEIKNTNYVSNAYTARQAAVQGINNLNSVLSISDEVGGGPGTSLLAKVAASIGSMTNTQVSQAINKIIVLDKDNIQLTNSAMKAIGATRPGIGLATLEKAGQPNSDMPPEARRQVALQLYASYLDSINHADAIISAPNDMPVDDRIKLAIKHDDSNPALLSDGHTINPDFMSFSDWMKHVRDSEGDIINKSKEIRNADGAIKPQEEAPQGQPPTDNKNTPKADPLGLFPK